MQFIAKVIVGKGRGKRLGFPTANLDKMDLDIKHGVYLVEVEINRKPYSGLLHFGPKKTFNEGVSLELHIENFNFDIYSKNVKIKIINKIRDVMKFDSAESLKEQISKDLKKLNKEL
ncbi:MAG: riboflavin kinase [Patescibacteria group bacterium]|nr:riboflavin kinase [Patescibacteria group bacterium]